MPQPSLSSVLPCTPHSGHMGPDLWILPWSQAIWLHVCFRSWNSLWVIEPDETLDVKHTLIIIIISWKKEWRRKRIVIHIWYFWNIQKYVKMLVLPLITGNFFTHFINSFNRRNSWFWTTPFSLVFLN